MLNEDVPPFECWLRLEYAYDLRGHFGEFAPVLVLGLSSVEGQAIGFHCLTDRGALLSRMPLSALCHKQEAPVQPLDHLELWDCFSYSPAVHEFRRLSRTRVRTVLKDGREYEGTYMFTVDWFDSPESESAGDSGWKCAHVLELDNGNYAAQPNNRILWFDPSWVAHPYVPGDRPRYRLNTHTWKVESVSTWTTENSPTWAYRVTRGR